MNSPFTRPTRTAPTGTRERNVRNGQRRGSAVDRENVGIILPIRAQEQRNDLGVVKIACGKERPQRAIRHPRGEGFLLGRAPLALEITAGKFADCRRFFAIIDCERKPILTFLDLGGGDGAAEHHGVTAGNDNGAVGQLRDFASLDRDLEGPDLGRDLVLHIQTAFWNWLIPGRSPLIVGFNPESLGTKTSNQRWSYGPDRRVYFSG